MATDCRGVAEVLAAKAVETRAPPRVDEHTAGVAEVLAAKAVETSAMRLVSVVTKTVSQRY